MGDDFSSAHVAGLFPSPICSPIIKVSPEWHLELTAGLKEFSAEL